MKVFIVLMTFIIFQELAFSARSVKVYRDNVPVEYIRDENNMCVAYGLSHHGQETYSSNSWLYPPGLESIYCERMFAKSAKDFLTNLEKGSPAYLNNFEEPFLIQVKDVKEIQFKITPKSRVRFKSYLVDNRINEFKESTIEEIKEKWSANYRSAVVKHRDFYLNFNPYHSGLKQKGGDFLVDKQFLKEAHDWEEIYYLNVWAKNLWDELVLKLGADQARIFYFTLDNKILDEDTQNVLKDKIKIFHMGVRSYLETTLGYDTAGLSLLKNYHPLFVQVLIESLADFKHFYHHTIKASHDKSYMIEIMKYLFILTENQVVADYHRLATLAKIQEENGKLRRYINTIIMLNMVDDNCHTLGLWPGALKWFVDIFGPSRMDITYYKDPLTYIINNITAKTYNLCGDFSPYTQFNFWGGTPMREWNEGIKMKQQDFNKLYKKLFNRF